MALVVGQLEIGDLRAVLVPAAGLSQVHAYMIIDFPRSVKQSCAYAFGRFRAAHNALTRDDVTQDPRKCLRTPEPRTELPGFQKGMWLNDGAGVGTCVVQFDTKEHAVAALDVLAPAEWS